MLPEHVEPVAPAIPVAESSRIAIVLALPALRGAFQVQAGLQEIVIAQGHRLGARLQAHRERLDGGLPACLARTRDIGGRLAEAGKGSLIIAKHQPVAIRAVFEVIVQAFLGTQALQEIEVRLGVLHAVLARRVVAAQLEAPAISRNTMLVEQRFQDLRDRALLEDAAVAAQGEPQQVGSQVESIVTQRRAARRLLDALHQAVNAPALRRIQAQKGWLLQQRREIHIRVGADQLQAEAVGLADASCPTKASTCRSSAPLARCRVKSGWAMTPP